MYCVHRIQLNCVNKGPRIVIAMRRVFVSNNVVAAIIALMSVWGKVWKVNILILP